MKKIGLTLFAVLGGFGFLACNAIVTTDPVLESEGDIYAFSAISAVDLMASTSTALSQRLSMHLADGQEPVVEAQLDELNKYLNMMEKFLGDSEGYSFESAASDRPEYTTMITFTATDILGDPVTYVLYYNEEALMADPVNQPLADDPETTTTETEEEETEEEETEEEESETSETEEESEETETKITGLLVIGETEYPITGKKEIENNESKIEIISQIDPDNYVKVVSKMEGSERKFEYTVVTDGVLVQSSRIKIEKEANETKFDLSFVSGNVTGEYEFKEETEDGETVLKIQYQVSDNGVEESGEMKILVETDPITGDSTYSYYVKSDDGEETEYEKEREDEEDEEDEEEVEEESAM